ncbi:MAG: flavodoxin [Bacteroides sp.]|nr:flavodoxin [Bacteroides sp.]
MKKIGIFYGSNTGMTAEVAEEIAASFGISKEDVHNVSKSAPSEVAPYDVLLLGTSTWGNGELQDDWYDFIDGLEALDLKGKKIALFGCGDETMRDTFCGAIGELYNRLQKTGATFVGAFDANVYDFDNSPAFIDGVYVGLCLDQVNKEELTAPRIKEWVAKVKTEI